MKSFLFAIALINNKVRKRIINLQIDIQFYNKRNIINEKPRKNG